MSEFACFFKKRYKLVIFLSIIAVVLSAILLILDLNPFSIVSLIFSVDCVVRFVRWKNYDSPFLLSIDHVWIFLCSINKEEKYKDWCFIEAIIAAILFMYSALISIFIIIVNSIGSLG